MSAAEGRRINVEYILLAVQKPQMTVPHEEWSWLDCTRDLHKFQKSNAGVEYLGENVLLIPQDQNKDLFSQILRLLHGHRCKYAILPEKPSWVMPDMGL